LHVGGEGDGGAGGGTSQVPHGELGKQAHGSLQDDSLSRSPCSRSSQIGRQQGSTCISQENRASSRSASMPNGSCD
tara:strand:- start:468 stop:695 length:228 start_codon:yes stop_codon:yes gene_type:complete